MRYGLDWGEIPRKKRISLRDQPSGTAHHTVFSATTCLAQRYKGEMPGKK
jgi:hypothetical protein